MDPFTVFCRQITIIPTAFVEETVFSPHNVFDAFFKNKEGIAVWIHIQVLYFVPLIFISVFD
jgi:hypothetical protein